MSNIPIVSTAAVFRVAASDAVFLHFLRCCLRRFPSGGRGDIPPEVAGANSMDPAAALGAYFFYLGGPPRMVSGKAEASQFLVLFTHGYLFYFIRSEVCPVWFCCYLGASVI